MLSTPWGYSVDADEMPPIVDYDAFIAATGDAFAAEAEERVTATVEAASAAVRAYCGWHVSPSLACHIETEGPGALIELPVMAVSSVEAVTVDGEAIDADAYWWRADGLLRRKPPHRWPAEWRSVVVDLTAGHDATVAPQLAAVVCQMASNALAAAPGVMRESAGGVSISYNSMADGVAGGVTLLTRDMRLLAPFRLPAVPR